MKAIDPAVELKEATFQTPSAMCYDLYFTGVGDARVYTKFLRPRNIVGKCPAVIIFHGYSCHSGNWENKLAYVSEGFYVFALDASGQGGKSEDVGGVRGNTLRGHIIRGLDDEDPISFCSGTSI